MRHFKFQLLFFFCFIQFHAQAQFSSKGEGMFLNGFRLYAAPSSLFDTRGRILPLGFEYCYLDHWGVSFESAIPVQQLMKTTTGEPIYSDLHLRLSLRRYFGKIPQIRGFWGVEGIYRNQYFHLKEGEFRTPTPFTFREADVRRVAYKLGFNLGLDWKLFSRCYLDLYMGAGLKAFTRQYSNVGYQSPPGEYDPAGFLTNFEEWNYTNGVSPYITYGLQIHFPLFADQSSGKWWR